MKNNANANSRCHDIHKCSYFCKNEGILLIILNVWIIKKKCFILKCVNHEFISVQMNN